MQNLSKEPQTVYRQGKQISCQKPGCLPRMEHGGSPSGKRSRGWGRSHRMLPKSLPLGVGVERGPARCVCCVCTAACCHSRISLLSSAGASAVKASLVGAKKVSAPCWFKSSVIPAVWMAPTRWLKVGGATFDLCASVSDTQQEPHRAPTNYQQGAAVCPHMVTGNFLLT